MLQARWIVWGVLCVLVIGFIPGCARFNASNFNECIACSIGQGYYLKQGSCALCPRSPNNITDCSVNKTTSQSTQHMDLSNSSNSSVDQGLNGTNRMQQATENTSKGVRSETNSVKDSSLSVLESQLALIMKLVPSNCVNFAVRGQVIVCAKCEDLFSLNALGVCVKPTISGQNTTGDSPTKDNKTQQLNIQQSGINKIYSNFNDRSNQLNLTSNESKNGPVGSEQTHVNSNNQSSEGLKQVNSSLSTINKALPQSNTKVETFNTSTTASTQQLYSSPIPTSVPLNSQKPILSVSGLKTGPLSADKTASDLNCMLLNRNYSPLQTLGSSNVKCLQCFASFYYSVETGVCLPKNPLCRECDNSNSCLSCYPGYALVNKNCVIPNGQITIQVGSAQPQYSPSQSDPNCQKQKSSSNQCLTCATRYYADASTGICSQVDPSCRTWNSLSGACLSCYTGYSPSFSNPKLCVPSSQSTTSSASNPGQFTAPCNAFVNNVCTQCVNRHFLVNGLCFPVSDFCKTFNKNFGYCLTCYDGYVLSEGACVVPTLASSKDPFCSVWGDGGCSVCITNYYPDPAGSCTAVSALCNGYNPQNGHCTGCFPPYVLSQTGECLYL